MGSINYIINMYEVQTLKLCLIYAALLCYLGVPDDNDTLSFRNVLDMLWNKRSVEKKFTLLYIWNGLRTIHGNLGIQ